MKITAGAGDAQVSSNQLQESNCITTNGGYNSLFVFPDVLAIGTTVTFRFTVGSLSVAANNRGVGGGIANSDGSKAVYFRVNSQSATATLASYTTAGGESGRTTSTQVGVPGDYFDVTATYGSVTAGKWTWTVSKNGGAVIAALTWTDSTNIIDMPGNHPVAAFRRQYASGQAASRGIASINVTAA